MNSIYPVVENFTDKFSNIFNTMGEKVYTWMSHTIQHIPTIPQHLQGDSRLAIAMVVIANNLFFMVISSMADQLERQCKQSSQSFSATKKKFNHFFVNGLVGGGTLGFNLLISKLITPLSKTLLASITITVMTIRIFVSLSSSTGSSPFRKGETLTDSLKKKSPERESPTIKSPARDSPKKGLSKTDVETFQSPGSKSSVKVLTVEGEKSEPFSETPAKTLKNTGVKTPHVTVSFASIVSPKKFAALSPQEKVTYHAQQEWQSKKWTDKLADKMKEIEEEEEDIPVAPPLIEEEVVHKKVNFEQEPEEPLIKLRGTAGYIDNLTQLSLLQLNEEIDQIETYIKLLEEILEPIRKILAREVQLPQEIAEQAAELAKVYRDIQGVEEIIGILQTPDPVSILYLQVTTTSIKPISFFSGERFDLINKTLVDQNQLVLSTKFLKTEQLKRYKIKLENLRLKRGELENLVETYKQELAQIPTLENNGIPFMDFQGLLAVKLQNLVKWRTAARRRKQRVEQLRTPNSSHKPVFQVKATSTSAFDLFVEKNPDLGLEAWAELKRDQQAMILLLKDGYKDKIVAKLQNYP